MADMTYAARYRSVCATCGETVEKGDECAWDGDAFVHVVCLNLKLDDSSASVCGSCFQTKAANGSCGCDD